MATGHGLRSSNHADRENSKNGFLNTSGRENWDKMEAEKVGKWMVEREALVLFL